MKHIFIISFLFLLMVGIVSAASAEEYNYANATAFLNNISNLEDNSIVTINDSEAIFSGTKTITANNITIKANGTVTFNGSYDGNFEITGNNVTLKYITFVNCYYNDIGAIQWSGSDGTVEHCNFTNNSGVAGLGAICFISETGKNVVKYCNFINNTASDSGGAIYMGSGLIQYCNFENNGAPYDIGGAISLFADNYVIDNCNFTNNHAKTYNGSAIYINSSLGTISNCNFNNDTIYLDSDGYKTTLLNNSFSNGANKVNIVNNNNQGFKIVGGENALILFVGNGGTISSNLTVMIDDKMVETDKETNLTAIIMADGVNNTIIGLPFSFTVNDNNFTGKVNGTCYMANYTTWLAGLYTISGACSNVNPDNITYRTAKLLVYVPTAVGLHTNTTAVYGENITLSIGAYRLDNMKEINGNVSLIIDGNIYKDNIKLENGFLKYNITDLSTGEHSIIAKVNNTDYCYGESNCSVINVMQATPNVSIDYDNITYGDNVTVLVTVTGNGRTPTDNVSLYINKKSYKTEVLNSTGQLKFIIPNLSADKYLIQAVYSGNENYTTADKTVNLTVDKATTILKVNITKTFDDEITIIALNLTDKNGKLINGTVEVNVTSSNYNHIENVTIADGKGTLALNNLTNGIYNITATFKATANYTGSYDSADFIINYTPTSYHLNATNVDKYFMNGTQYHVTLTDNHGNLVANKTILVTLDCDRWRDLKYNITTNASGIATLDINLIADEYHIVATFDNATPVSNNITVRPVTYILEAEDLVKYFENSTQYCVKVTDQSGNIIANQTVVVKVFSERWLKAVEYNIKTNSSGVAVLPINLLSGIYSITSTLDKAVKYNKIAVLPTLTANNLVKKVSQSASLTARLVDDQGNPVEGKEVKFTVKTKTYTFKTDSNGIATLPIHLGLGTWSFLISSDNTETRATVKVIK